MFSHPLIVDPSREERVESYCEHARCVQPKEELFEMRTCDFINLELFEPFHDMSTQLHLLTIMGT